MAGVARFLALLTGSSTDPSSRAPPETELAVGHTGDQAGYRSYIYFDPAAAGGIILVFNTTNDHGAGDSEMAALAREGLAALAH